MKDRSTSVRLFQLGVHLWLLGFLLSALPAMGDLWLHPISPVLHPPGPFTPLTHALGSWLPQVAVLPGVAIAIVLCLRGLFRPARWWSAAALWFIFVNLMHTAWMAGSGGQQLMANLLFWNILLSLPLSGLLTEWLSTLAFWVIRGQLLLAYAVTGLHKLSGEHWTDGTALGIVATDPAFGPPWIATVPALAAVLTVSVLLFQLTVPFAVWWRRTRLPWMLFGIAFHLGTALWMDIPEMGLAFIVAYAIWLDEKEAGWFLTLRDKVLRTSSPG
jgi:hypothetical protein